MAKVVHSWWMATQQGKITIWQWTVSACTARSITAKVVVMCSCKCVSVAKKAISQCRQENREQMQRLSHKLISAFIAKQCKLYYKNANKGRHRGSNSLSPRSTHKKKKCRQLYQATRKPHGGENQKAQTKRLLESTVQVGSRQRDDKDEARQTTELVRSL